MYFRLFLTKLVGVNENLEGWEAPEWGGGNLPPDKSSTVSTQCDDIWSLPLCPDM